MGRRFPHAGEDDLETLHDIGIELVAPSGGNRRWDRLLAGRVTGASATPERPAMVPYLKCRTIEKGGVRAKAKEGRHDNGTNRRISK